VSDYLVVASCDYMDKCHHYQCHFHYHRRCLSFPYYFSTVKDIIIIIIISSSSSSRSSSNTTGSINITIFISRIRAYD
jgi:hypothetical protein